MIDWQAAAGLGAGSIAAYLLLRLAAVSITETVRDFFAQRRDKRQREIYEVRDFRDKVVNLNTWREQQNEWRNNVNRRLDEAEADLKSVKRKVYGINGSGRGKN